MGVANGMGMYIFFLLFHYIANFYYLAMSQSNLIDTALHKRPSRKRDGEEEEEDNIGYKTKTYVLIGLKLLAFVAMFCAFALLSIRTLMFWAPEKGITSG